MGIKYIFKLSHLDYHLTTRSESWGTDSKVELQVLRNPGGGNWEIVSDRWTEPGNTQRLDAGRVESFSRAFGEPIDIGGSVENPLAYRSMVRFRFRIYGGDAWSPSKIRMIPTFLRSENFGVDPPALWTHVTETWVYTPNQWILSTDPADGTSKDSDGNPATLTLGGPPS